MHAFRKTNSPPFSPLVTVPVNATLNPATIDAVCLSELIILSNSTPIPCPSFPVGLTHSPIRSRLTHSLAPRSPRATLLYLPATRSVSIGGQGARNLFVGRSWTAYGATPTQPDSQPKSISVALPTATESSIPALAVLYSLLSPTATQTPDTCFLCSLCPCPLLRLCAPL